jgi:pimeloyl-ACP methyl ester carboxylesterase
MYRSTLNRFAALVALAFACGLAAGARADEPGESAAEFAQLATASAPDGSAPDGRHRFSDQSTEWRLLASARTITADLADHSLRHWVRDRLYDEETAARYGLRLDADWEAAAAEAPDAPLVVLIHGFNSSTDKNAGILAPLRAAGLPIAAFVYPNDWELERSAALLSQALTELAKQHGDRRVALITHSMGGLVARACIENPELDPGNVVRLIMIAPPTHGSLMAHASFAGDLWEHWIARRDGSVWRRWKDSVVDGLGEASDDLVPGSPFLTTLNARPRNARVQYAIFLGTHSPVTAGEMQLARWALGRAARREMLARYAGSVDAMLADMDEVIDGRGDGVVAVKRGRLEGVDDTVELPFDHLNCTDAPEDDAVRQLQTELLARLQQGA